MGDRIVIVEFIHSLVHSLNVCVSTTHSTHDSKHSNEHNPRPYEMCVLLGKQDKRNKGIYDLILNKAKNIAGVRVVRKGLSEELTSLPVMKRNESV